MTYTTDIPEPSLHVCTLGTQKEIHRLGFSDSTVAIAIQALHHSGFEMSESFLVYLIKMLVRQRVIDQLIYQHRINQSPPPLIIVRDDGIKG